MTVLVVFSSPTAVQSFWPQPVVPQWSGASIRVRIHDQLEEQLKHRDGSLWTRQEVEIAVERVLMRANASSGADTPWLFLDYTTAPSTCAWLDSICEQPKNINPLPDTCGLANTIHIVPSNCQSTALGPSSLAPPSHILYVEKFSSGLGGDARWEHAPLATANAFEATLLHEIGHSLGLLHPQDDVAGFPAICPGGQASEDCSVMGPHNNNFVSADNFMYDDTQGLRQAYGYRTAPAESLLEAEDLDVGFTGLSVGNIDAQGFFAASSRPTGSIANLTIVGYRRNALSSVPMAYNWDWTSLALTSLGNPHIFSGNGPVGAAHSATTRFVTSSAWRNTADLRKWDRRLVVSSRPIDGSTWTTALSNPAVDALDDTVAPGVSSAFDPRSTALLTAMRARDGRVILQDFYASTFGAALDTGIRSITTPLVACTTATPPAHNCILVTVDPGKPVTTATTQRLQWTEFSWNRTADAWTPGLLHTESFLMRADMSLAAHADGLSWEFVVAYQVPLGATGTQTYLLRKAPGEASSFVLWGATTTSPAQTSFAFVGSTSSYIESFSLSHP